jgi:predicted alpha/beta hydrolase
VSDTRPLLNTLQPAVEPLRLPEPRELVKSTAKAALAAAFRGVQPDSRERYTRAPERVPLRRLYYRTDDGWQAPLFQLEPLPGASGEPLVLLHDLGVNRHSLDFAEGLSLARSLRQAGYTVFLMEHRGDRSAVPPEHPLPYDFDTLATQDLPCAIDLVLEVSGFSRVMAVGHSFGGQLLYAHLAHSRGAELAALVTLGAAVEFRAPASQARALRLASHLLPAGLTLPLRAASVLSSPSASSPGRCSGEVRRGLLVHGSEDLSLGLARQVLRWLETGHLVDRDDRVDYVEALTGLRVPTMVVASQGDALCRPEQAVPVLDRLAGPTRLLELDRSWGHFDALLSEQAPELVHRPLVEFLEPYRRDCW